MRDHAVVPFQHTVVHGDGTPSELYVSQERNLNAARYERVPGIEPAEANQIFLALLASGIWDGRGNRIEPNVETAATKAYTAPLPNVGAPRSEINNESAVILAIHQFSAEYANQAIAFFDRYLP